MSIPDLDARFLEPPNWQWGSFSHIGKNIRFGSVSPKNSKPDAIVVCLPGLSEYAEKYFETARDVVGMNMEFWVIDWAGQGRSDRYINNSDKRHSDGLQNDVDDLAILIQEHIKPANSAQVPMVMLAHSMGGNIGLHYIKQNPDVFACAGFSAPMWGLNAVKRMSPSMALSLTGLMNNFFGTLYAPGQMPWNEIIRKSTPLPLSHDPVRSQIHDAWLKENKGLRIGGVTWGWLHHAVKSCQELQNPDFLKDLKTHFMVATASHDFLVDNAQILEVTKHLPHVKVIEIKGAGHEILMETDERRGLFLKAFHNFIKENAMHKPETLKPN